MGNSEENVDVDIGAFRVKKQQQIEMQGQKELCTEQNTWKSKSPFCTIYMLTSGTKKKV